MSIVLFIIVLIALIWFLALLGRERARREALRLRVEMMEARLARAYDNDENLGSAVAAIAEAQSKAVTPDAFDTLLKAHLDLVERHACLARKTSTLPG